MTVRQAYPPINFCLLLMLSVAVVAGSLQVERQQHEIERHAAELRFLRRHGERLVSEMDALRTASARMDAPTALTQSANAAGEER